MNDPRLDAWVAALGARLHERNGQLRFRPSTADEWAGFIGSVIDGMFTEPMPPFPFAEVIPPETDEVTKARAAIAHEDSLGDIGCVDRPADALHAAKTFRDAYNALLVDYVKMVREKGVPPSVLEAAEKTLREKHLREAAEICRRTCWTGAAGTSWRLDCAEEILAAIDEEPPT